MILYPEFPFNLSSPFILSQSIIAKSAPKCSYINVTKVDLPHAIPPVKPNILIFFICLPNRKTNKQGNRVLNKGSIPLKTNLARRNYIIG